MLRYIKFSIGFLFAGIALLHACRPKEVTTNLPPDYFTIIAGESVLTSTGITVIGDTVNVSICPQNTYCIVADNVSVSLRVVKGIESQRVRLFAPVNNYGRRANAFYGDSASILLDNQSYKVILRRGQYVDKSENTRISQAIIQVSRL